MPQIYNEEFRKKIVRLHLQEGRTYKSLIEEFGVSKASISKWCRDFSKECQCTSSAQKNLETMQEIRQLRKQLQELEKENAFKKKSDGILCKGNKVEIYHFISANKKAFGLRWLLNRCKVYPNAYYNFLKNRKAKYHLEKQHILAQIEEIYHSHNGIDGYRKIERAVSIRLCK